MQRPIAEVLNARGVRTARGGEWHATTVRELLIRLPWEKAADPYREREGRLPDLVTATIDRLAAQDSESIIDSVDAEKLYPSGS